MEQFGSPRFYSLTQDMRYNIESDTHAIIMLVKNTASNNHCTDYDACCEAITVYMLQLKDAIHSYFDRRIAPISRMIASLAITAILCRENWDDELPSKSVLVKKTLEWLDNLDELHSCKNHDYASEHPLSNFMACAVVCDMRLPDTGLFYLVTKKERLRTIRQKGHCMVDENVTETLRDMAVYALLTVIMHEVELAGWDKYGAKDFAWRYLE